MNLWEALGTALGGGGVFGGVFKLLTLRAQRRKLTSDGDAALVRASTEFGNTAWTQVKQLAADVDELRADQRKQSHLLAAHEQWDRETARALRELGQAVSDPPPLYVDDRTP